MFDSSVKSVSGPNASTATLKYGPNILIAHGTTKGGGVAGPLGSKRLLKGTFFLLDPFPYVCSRPSVFFLNFVMNYNLLEYFLAYICSGLALSL